MFPEYTKDQIELMNGVQIAKSDEYYQLMREDIENICDIIMQHHFKTVQFLLEKNNSSENISTIDMINIFSNVNNAIVDVLLYCSPYIAKIPKMPGPTAVEYHD